MLDTSRLRKKPFRTLLSLSVISPRGGELNTSGAERRSELTSPRGANQKGTKPVLSQGAERLFIKKSVFPHPARVLIEYPHPGPSPGDSRKGTQRKGATSGKNLGTTASSGGKSWRDCEFAGRGRTRLAIRAGFRRRADS